MLLSTTLEAAAERLQQIKIRVSSLTQSQLEQMQRGIWIRMLLERTDSATIALQELSQQLQPLSAEGSVVIAHTKLATLEARARMLATTLAFLLSEVEEMRSNELDSQLYADLLSIEEWITIANNATEELSRGIAGISESGGDVLGYAALDDLRQELQLALLTSDSSATRVVDKAVVSSSTATSFGRYKNVLVAVVAGLLVGILGALVFQHFDRRVRDASQVAGYVKLPMMARVPLKRGTEDGHPHSALRDSSSQYLEAFRMLRTNLGLDSCSGKVLLVSSPEAGEGKTTVAANLARAVALQGRRVLLIDGNLRKPDIAATFGLPEADGFPEFLTGRNELLDYIIQAEGVDILPSGAASAESAEVLSSPRIKTLLEKARQDYDVVIIDSAPMVGCADTRILAREADEVLLVLQPDISKLDITKDSKQTLEAMGTRVSGFVLNKVSPKECDPVPLFVINKPQKQN
jgi:capsular exopolysaccharide synthesis family protein